MYDFYRATFILMLLGLVLWHHISTKNLQPIENDLSNMSDNTVNNTFKYPIVEYEDWPRLWPKDGYRRRFDHIRY